MGHVIGLLGRSWMACGFREAIRSLGSSATLTEVTTVCQALAHLSHVDKAMVFLHAASYPGALEDLSDRLADFDSHPGFLAIVPPGTHMEVLGKLVRPGRGFLFETSHPDLLPIAIQEVAEGRPFVEPSLCGTASEQTGSVRTLSERMQGLDPKGLLPERFRRVVLPAALGFTDEEIGTCLFKDRETVGAYLYEAYRILGIVGGRRDLNRRILGRPPCGGHITRCPDPGRSGHRPHTGELERCPFFMYCVAAY